MGTLYTLSGSTHSARAMEAMASMNVDFESVQVSDEKHLAALYRELGIRELPLLIVDRKRLVGLREIEYYVENGDSA